MAEYKNRNPFGESKKQSGESRKPFGEAKNSFAESRKSFGETKKPYEKRTKSPEKALDALRFMSSKMERSVTDVQRSLYNWGVEKSEHQKIIDTLIDERFIDLERYTRAYINDKLSSGRWGRIKIVQGLRLKKIPDEIIEKYMDELTEKDDFTHKLSTIIQAKAKELAKKNYSPYELRARLFRFAASRGYDIDEINDALERLKTEDL